MGKAVSPLVGYNTNVRHKNKLYHIQTEDSGIQHPHIITHLFADGGRIIASKKTSYAEYIGREDLPKLVKQLMQGQHKAMFIALRDCVYDDDALEAASPATAEAARVNVEALERAAQAHTANSPLAAPGQADPRPGSGRYQATLPASLHAKPPATADAPTPPRDAGATARAAANAHAGPAHLESAQFRERVTSEKSLDEVILSYLAEDVDEPAG